LAWFKFVASEQLRKPGSLKALARGKMRNKSFAGRIPAIPFSCVPHVLEHHAKRIPEAPAILAPERLPLTYRQLYEHIENTGHTLRTLGIGRQDRVVVALPNGPEMAVAILAVAASAVCAPVNPAYQSEELNKYFADLRPRALITQVGIDSPARRAAVSHDMRVIELLVTLDAEAGVFTLIGEREDARSDEFASPSDVAVLLLTSGTTARPKIVPQTHANICASAFSSVTAWSLSESDRCINMLPLFHGHGLHNTLMASLAAGASVVCTPGWDANGFFAWLTTYQPTWYSAVPTIHQAILTQARHNCDRLADCRLRFIRSGSAPLPARVLGELESTFAAPVIEYYAMTETVSTPIASNPLPPAQRKAGSAGKPASLDVAIMDGSGAILSTGQTGEVIVRGASVTAGYDGDPVANQAAFVGDWFRTGDLGYFDEDGYLFLAGRIREIINRGGEKVTPQEVDEVLLEHPAVAEAVTFAVPHPTLGEDVAAAIVLRPNATATTKEIRHFATGRVADFKVPRQIVIVSAIPKGPSGKLQRLHLAAKLGLASGGAKPQVFIAPRTSLERLLAEHWAEILQAERVGIHDDFFALGGDSLLVTAVLAHIYDAINVEIDASRFFEAPTIAETARYIETSLQDEKKGGVSSITPVPRKGPLQSSVPQERLWQLQRLLHSRPFFNVFCPLQLTSRVDAAILEQSINEIVQRHEILRTTFAEINGRCMQVIAPTLNVRLTVDDLHALREAKKESVAHQLIQAEVLHPFDLARGPLLRARLLRLAEQQHLLLITMHGIIVDAWSLGVLVKELLTVYDAFSAGMVSPLPPLSIQYADFAHWQRQWESHPEITAQLAYWREQLRDPLPPMRFVHTPQMGAANGFLTARRELTLLASLTEAAKLFSAQEGGTLYMALVAALKTLLQRYLGLDDLRVATLVANRNRPEADSLIGPLANTVILRTDLGGDPSMREVMRRVRRTVISAFAHQDLPFEELVDTLARERAFKPGPLAPVMIALHNSTLRPKIRFRHTLAVGEANQNMLGRPLVAPSTFDVSLMLRETVDGITGSCIYKPHLFDAVTIDNLLRHFQDVLQSMVTRPELPISEIHVSLANEA
jgi:acyl-CoA synthetase (AMP-forming)/AMP-acid ligase II